MISEEFFSVAMGFVCYAIATNLVLVYDFPAAQFLSYFRLLVFEVLADYLLACEKKKGRAQEEDEKKIGLADLGQHASFFSLSHN